MKYTTQISKYIKTQVFETVLTKTTNVKSGDRYTLENLCPIDEIFPLILNQTLTMEDLKRGVHVEYETDKCKFEYRIVKSFSEIKAETVYERYE